MRLLVFCILIDLIVGCKEKKYPIEENKKQFVALNTVNRSIPKANDSSNDKGGEIVVAGSEDVYAGVHSPREKKFVDILLSIDEVKKMRHYSDTHKKGQGRFAFIIEEPDSAHQYYVFRVGKDYGEIFRTRYLINIDSKSLRVFFDDPVTERFYSPEDFRKLKR